MTRDTHSSNNPQRHPFVSCLCPTYRRPVLLANALACYLEQDYPANHRELIILDDAGQFASQRGPGWELISVSRRFRSLPEKFSTLAGLAVGDIFVVWEDDDIYLPWHISSHVAALADCRFSKPSRIRSHVNGAFHEEGAAGRFHASIAFTRAAYEAAGGWPLTQRGDFDQQFLSRLTGLGPVGDPLQFNRPSYIFRWESTDAYHGQALMESPGDETWYARAVNSGLHDPQPHLTPEFDEHTQSALREFREDFAVFPNP